MSVGDQSGSTGNVGEAEEDTVELELTADEMARLTRSPAPQEEFSVSSDDRPIGPLASTAAAASDSFPIRVVSRDPKTPSTWAHIAPALSLGILVVGWAVLFTSHQSTRTDDASAQVPLHGAAVSPPLPATGEEVRVEQSPVRFVNPFDASEVFEFPPGTSVTDAQDAVADFLIQRARERQVLQSKGKRALRADRHTLKVMTAQNPSIGPLIK